MGLKDIDPEFYDCMLELLDLCEFFTQTCNEVVGDMDEEVLERAKTYLLGASNGQT